MQVCLLTDLDSIKKQLHLFLAFLVFH
jgi:hypothetical protein